MQGYQFRYPHQILVIFRDLMTDADAETLSPEATVDVPPFPSEAVDAAARDQSYEALEAADREVMHFIGSGGADLLAQAGRRAGIDTEALHIDLDSFRPFRQHIMPECQAAPGGGVKLVPHFAPHEEGSERFHSLGRAAACGAITASVFNSAVEAVDVYPGQEALDARLEGKPWPEPCGTRSEYRVAVLDGDVMIPPRRPRDIAADRGHDADRDPTP